ncbi:hypothetical protein GBA63_00090 [Rubrobacter tropicus]|uniref:Uncharacterized protein n=1 Tax=Rubrobacter tropicus TaxID=2653851 RepID=A0A6G8Q3Y1_9ACTN|nr:hypothetical protein [Rubrobacter tropicus]QIN81191.1 hypothetical protein GBA63_00090 [Rubrobacter tropicus]
MVAALFFASATVLILSGCASRTGEPEPASNGERVPDTAVVVCGRDETRVLTPRVEARSDGVHFEVRNRLGADTGFAALGREGGAGGEASKGGSSELVGDVSPGGARAGCEEPPYDGIGKINYAAFEVVDRRGLYKSVGLECRGGMAVSGGAQYAPGARGVKGDLVKRARNQFSDEIRVDDVVELAGYPKLPDYRIVRVVRDGRVVATVHFLGEGDGWLQDSYEACEGF